MRFCSRGESMAFLFKHPKSANQKPPKKDYFFVFFPHLCHSPLRKGDPYEYPLSAGCVFELYVNGEEARVYDVDLLTLHPNAHSHLHQSSSPPTIKFARQHLGRGALAVACRCRVKEGGRTTPARRALVHDDGDGCRKGREGSDPRAYLRGYFTTTPPPAPRTRLPSNKKKLKSRIPCTPLSPPPTPTSPCAL